MKFHAYTLLFGSSEKSYPALVSYENEWHIMTVANNFTPKNLRIFLDF